MIGKDYRITERLNKEDKYIYRLEAETTHYIIKGYEIPLEYCEIRDPNFNTTFTKSLNMIAEAYKEYYFHFITSMLCPYILKPLGIEYNAFRPTNFTLQSYLYIEILFEDGGLVISKYDFKDVVLAYGIMRASSTVLAFLHSFGFKAFNLTPDKMLYNKKDNKINLYSELNHFNMCS